MKTLQYLILLVLSMRVSFAETIKMGINSANQVEWTTQDGRIYTLEESETLAEDSWQILEPRILGTGENMQRVISAEGSDRRFYRVRSRSDPSSEPAPQTLDGLILRLWPGGPTFSFRRALGDAFVGTEQGALAMLPNPALTQTLDSLGNTVTINPASVISGARYSYRRLGPERGEIVITGESVAPPLQDDTYAYLYGFDFDNNINPFFSRTYQIGFTSNGNIVNGISILDKNSMLIEGQVGIEQNIQIDSGVPLVSQVAATFSFAGAITINNLAPLFAGYGPEEAGQLFLSPIYLPSIDRQQLVIVSNGSLGPSLGYTFSDNGMTDCFPEGDFSEDPIVANFTYNPIEGTVTDAVLVITREDPVDDVTYQLKFIDRENGIYEDSNGSSGTFRFPFGEDLP